MVLKSQLHHLIYFPLSCVCIFLCPKAHGWMVCRKKQVMGNHYLPKRALVQASHLLIGKLKYWESWDNEGIELWLPISFCILARTGEMPSALGLCEVKRWSFLSSWRWRAGHEETGEYMNTHYPYFHDIPTLQPVESSLALIL